MNAQFKDAVLSQLTSNYSLFHVLVPLLSLIPGFLSAQRFSETGVGIESLILLLFTFILTMPAYVLLINTWFEISKRDNLLFAIYVSTCYEISLYVTFLSNISFPVIAKVVIPFLIMISILYSLSIVVKREYHGNNFEYHYVGQIVLFPSLMFLFGIFSFITAISFIEFFIVSESFIDLLVDIGLTDTRVYIVVSILSFASLILVSGGFVKLFVKVVRYIMDTYNLTEEDRFTKIYEE